MAAARVPLGEVVNFADSDNEASPRFAGGAVPAPLPSFLSKQPSGWAPSANGTRGMQAAGAQANTNQQVDLTQVPLSVAGDAPTWKH